MMQVFHILSGWILGGLLLSCSLKVSAQTIYFVNANAEPGGDGTTWNTAFRDLQPALDSACLNAPVEIWVTAGTYYPSQNVAGNSMSATDRSNTFVMCSDVAVYGGFVGGETLLSERDWMTNLTRLSGDIDRDDIIDSNAYNVVTFTGTANSSVLDGFTITSGHANVTENIKTSEYSGGGFYFEDSEAVIRNCAISGNSALTGGGIFAAASSPFFFNCQITNNKGIGDFGRGAGLASVDGSVPSLESCILEGNVAESFGGGVYNSDSAQISLIHCTIRLNQAQAGAGLYSGSNSSANLINCLISENNVTEDGGGVYIGQQSKSAFSQCTLFQNIALGNGGGMWLGDFSELTIVESMLEANKGNNGGGIYTSALPEFKVLNTSIKGNESVDDGGGIYLQSTFATLTNCLISGNYSNGNGGALFNSAGFSDFGVIKITNCTISGNGSIGDGGGLYNDQKTVIDVSNSIIWNNVAADSTNTTSSSIHNEDDTEVNISYSLIQNSGGSVAWDSAIGIDLGENLDQDPLFVVNADILTLPNNTGDLHLQQFSPAINTGTLDTANLNLPVLDLDGNPRFVHDRIDLGVFEFQDDITLADCGINGPLEMLSYANALYSGPDNMAAYAWSIEGNGVIVGPDDQQTVTVVAGALNSFLLILTITDNGQNTATCARTTNIQLDCSLYDNVDVLYVDTNATGTHSGLSWDDAFTSLADALQVDCQGGKEVWVAAGTYYPTTTRHHYDASFYLKNDLALYGGFAGTELTLEERDIESNATILSGDIDQDGDFTGNVYNVINGSGTDTTAVLDGFMVSGGNAQWLFPAAFEERSSGGGLYIYQGSPIVSNCLFTGNQAYQGAGCINIGATPVMSNCTFSNNITLIAGRGSGMMNAENASPLLTNCSFNNNKADQLGAGMYNQFSSPILMNCSFQDNQVTSNNGRGGGMYNFSSAPTLTNCTFINNRVSGNGQGAGMFNQTNSSPLLTQCDFIGNICNRGAGMNNQNGSSPILIDCNFIQNETPFNGLGGGMLNQNSHPQLTGCLFEENIGYNYGGGMHNINSSPTLLNCTFIRNAAYDIGGGGISNRASSPIISSCVFVGNVTFDGGAIYNFESSSPALINCTISGNFGSRGGGILNDNAHPTLTNCILWNNSSNGDKDVTASSILNLNSSSPFVFNSLIANSGGSEFWSIDLGFDAGNNVDFDPLFVKDFDFVIFPDTMVDLRLTLCSSAIDAGTPDTMGLLLPAEDPDGNPRITNERIDLGAYEFNGMSGVPDCLIAGPDTVFTSSTHQFTGPAGMASYEWSVIGNGTIIGSSTDQEVTVQAGLVNSFSLVLHVQDPDLLCFALCTLRVDIIVDCSIFGTGDILYVDQKATGDNNGTSWSDAYTNLQDALKTNCPEVNQVWVAAGTYYPTTVATDRDATFQLVNNLKLYGGFAGTELTLDERDWQTNQTILSGDIDGDLSLANNVYTVVTGSGTDTTAQLDGFVITGGNADENGQGGDPHKSGGGMYTANGSPVVRNCNFTGNSVVWRGGGMYNVDASPMITNCTFSGNNANESGGGMFYDHSSAVLSDCTFNGNLAETLGGGISMVNGSTGQMTNCTFEGNVVSAFASGGGGINIDSSAPVLTRCIFRNNTAVDGSGGGIHISTSAQPVLVRCTFEENHAVFGGGMREHGSSSFYIACTFIGNTAMSGAGVSVTATSSSTFTNCQFINNSASNFGGGFQAYFSALKITNCAFTANTAQTGGGGTFFFDSSIDAVNSTFTGNGAVQDGGGILSDGNSILKLTNCTISGNDAGGNGGGINNLDSASVTLTNSIIWNNRANASTLSTAASIFNDTSSVTAVSYSLVANSGSSQNWNNEIGVDLGNNLDADPHFVEDVDVLMVPDTSGDMHLLMTSPAIQAGTPDTTGLHLPTEDADGNPRIFNLRIDLGPYEYQGIVSVAPGNDSFLSLDVHPNPARDILYVMTSEDAGDFIIIDAAGNIVGSYMDLVTNPERKIKLDISNLTPGLYTLLFSSKNGPVGVAKFAVIR